MSATISRAAHVDYYLDIEGIPGEVTVANHAAQIAVDYFHSSGFQRALATVAGGTASPSKAVIKPIEITKPVDSASPKLFVACMSGQRIAKATLYADYFANDQDSVPAGTFLKITLTDVFIASVDQAGARTSVQPRETVTLSFRTMEMSYSSILANGTLGPATIASFNFTRNTAGQ